MIFNEFKQNRSIIASLQKNISKGRISHAYILEGVKELDKLRFAQGFAEQIFCKDLSEQEMKLCKSALKNGNHPDVAIISHPEKPIKDEEIFSIQGRLNTAPVTASHKIIIVDGADSMTARAQNRILKTLEEPKIDCVMIFLSENSENLLQTIRSRCIILSLKPELFEISGEDAQLLNIARGLIISLKNKEPFHRLTKNYEEYFVSKQNAEILLNEMENLLSKDFLSAALSGQSESMAKAVELISRAVQDLKIGVKPSYAMKNLLIQLEDIL